MVSSIRRGLAAAILGAACAGLPASAFADALQVAAVSARANMVTGGDVLVSISNGQALVADAVRISVNGTPVSTPLVQAVDGGALLGLVSGLRPGANAITVSAAGGEATLWVDDHPIEGPVFSGPHEQPFSCESEKFKLQVGGTLGAALDEHCSVPTRVDYAYRSTGGGALKPWPQDDRPADLGTIRTAAGQTLPYVVRIETGTINRAIYQTVMLHDPATAAPGPGRRSAAWNGRLIYTFGGGCSNGWYRQASTTGPVDEDLMLGRGYAVASASLNVFGNNCNDLLAAETMMMVKERFVETYGVPLFTIGWGCSGGSYQVLQIADNYPGLLDGIIPGCTFPDVGFGTVPTITDARLLNRYFSSATLPFSDEQKRAVTGFVKLETMETVTAQAGRIAVSEFCPDALPQSARYDPVKNPGGARCNVFDHTVNVYGRDPRTGFARRPLDNVGIQYGLKALNDGVISAAQFLDLNERIGGYDNDGVMVAARTEGDLDAIRAAYRTGRLTSGSGGLKTTPVIEYRGYADDGPKGDLHLRFYSFSMRERLKKANGGHADQYVMLVEDNRRGLFSVESPVLQNALAHMDAWLTAIASDHTGGDPAARILRSKPSDLVDACWTRDADPQRIAEPQQHGAGRCNELYPSASFPREVAGASIASDVVKCTLKPIDPADYKKRLSADELTRLKRIFPGGVCDWSKPGMGQEPLAGTWLTLGGS
ncbi:MAG: DUF6351 family protein [Vicinamibacterales bacterium]